MHGLRGIHDRSAKPPAQLFFEREADRGYPAQGVFWDAVNIVFDLQPGGIVALCASTETAAASEISSARDALETECRRRSRLLEAKRRIPGELTADLMIAPDAFVITPEVARAHDRAKAKAEDDDVRSIIAGYHWFTDWGRDAMISLEGLTLVTERYQEAGCVLRTFARYMRDGLIPQLFPEGRHEAVYRAADATFWFFHALARYVSYTGDFETLRALLPKLVESFHAHVRGTRFGIGVDPHDGLLRAGTPDHPLTWMDAQVGDWIVTPRRGKPVEVNALWYNALRLLERWLAAAGEYEHARDVRAHADRAYDSFNARFWFAAGGYLYDVVDGDHGDDASFRPNQLFAVSLPFPVLARERWRDVLDKVRSTLLTPRGLRTLAPRDPKYKAQYDGDRRARDAAYHQGTVWPWLLGSYCDAFVKVYPGDTDPLRNLLRGMRDHMRDAGIGFVSEIFDAEPPFAPRGSIARAWSVAELLRALVTYGEGDASRLVSAAR